MRIYCRSAALEMNFSRRCRLQDLRFSHSTAKSNLFIVNHERFSVPDLVCVCITVLVLQDRLRSFL